jgi:hypothetical protein
MAYIFELYKSKQDKSTMLHFHVKVETFGWVEHAMIQRISTLLKGQSSDGFNSVVFVRIILLKNHKQNTYIYTELYNQMEWK